MKWLRLVCALSSAAVGSLDAPIAAQAQDYPTKPIRLIVATAAGGLMDVAARVAADNLDKSLGQRLVIENRSGSGGNIGAEAVAKAEPDGYTLGLVQIGNVAINPYVYTDMTFDPFTDLVPVAPVTSSAILVVANAKVPANDLQELIALAKREPGKLSYGSAGNGTAPHLAGEMFKAAAGVDILHVPYRGAGPAVNDTVGGHVQLTFVGLGAVRGSGRCRPCQDPGGRATAAAQGGAAVSDVGRGRAAGLRVRDVVRHRRAEGHAGAGDRQAGEAHPCDAGRSGGPAQLGRRRAGGSQGNAGAVRRAHAPRSRALPRHRQGGEAEAGVKRWAVSSIKKVLVVGGGIAGLTLAVALRRRDIDVDIVELAAASGTCWASASA